MLGSTLLATHILAHRTQSVCMAFSAKATDCCGTRIHPPVILTVLVVCNNVQPDTLLGMKTSNMLGQTQNIIHLLTGLLLATAVLPMNNTMLCALHYLLQKQHPTRHKPGRL